MHGLKSSMNLRGVRSLLLDRNTLLLEQVRGALLWRQLREQFFFCRLLLSGSLGHAGASGQHYDKADYQRTHLNSPVLL